MNCVRMGLTAAARSRRRAAISTVEGSATAAASSRSEGTPRAARTATAGSRRAARLRRIRRTRRGVFSDSRSLNERLPLEREDGGDLAPPRRLVLVDDLVAGGHVGPPFV